MRPTPSVDASTLALPQGMRDLLPAHAATRRAIARFVHEAFCRWGYSPVVPPAFERESVIARAAGGAIRRELIRFLDPDSGEVLVLRPDMTPQIARIAATRLSGSPLPFRLSYEGSVVRRPSGRAQRQRQLSQAGIECIGWSASDADVEVITATLAALHATGLTALTLSLSHASALQPTLDRVPTALREEIAVDLSRRDRATWRARLAAYPTIISELDALDSLSGLASGLIERANTNKFTFTDPRHSAVIKDLDTITKGVSLSTPFERNLTVNVDLCELRGRGYYTGIFFEILSPHVGRPLAAGGRYDELLSRFGVPWPATGAAIDLESVEVALEHSGTVVDTPTHPRVLLVGRGESRTQRAKVLRDTGAWVTEIEPHHDLDAFISQTQWTAIERLENQ